jgi:Periplasmic binding protein-like domain
MTRLLGLSEADVTPLISLSLFGVEGGAAAAGRLLDRGVTGIVCGSDLMALGAIREARSRGLRVPADVSIVGYDDSPLVAFTDPPLTTVRQPVSAMAVAGVRALIDEINGHPAPHSEYVFSPELVVRGSTAIAPDLTPAPRNAKDSTSGPMAGPPDRIQGAAKDSTSGPMAGPPDQIQGARAQSRQQPYALDRA